MMRPAVTERSKIATGKKVRGRAARCNNSKTLAFRARCLLAGVYQPNHRNSSRRPMITLSQSPNAGWRNSFAVGYQGESPRSRIQRKSAA
jgi:hypothetical protein